MTAWLAWIAAALGAGRYKPSAVALASDPIMMALFVSGWVAAGGAFLAIGAALLLRRWRHITMSPAAATLFGVLFILVGVDLWMSATTVFFAVYRLKVLLLGLTAAVAVTTAVLTIAQIFGAARGVRGE